MSKKRKPCDCGNADPKLIDLALALWNQHVLRVSKMLDRSGGVILPEAPEPPLDDQGEPDPTKMCDDNPEVSQLSVWAPAYIKWCQCEAAVILAGNLLSEYDPLAKAYAECRGIIV